jgi:hypothetical protein
MITEAIHRGDAGASIGPNVALLEAGIFMRAIKNSFRSYVSFLNEAVWWLCWNDQPALRHLEKLSVSSDCGQCFLGDTRL